LKKQNLTGKEIKNEMRVIALLAFVALFALVFTQKAQPKGFNPKKYASCMASKLGIDANKAISCVVKCKKDAQCYPSCLGIDAEKALVAAVACALSASKKSGKTAGVPKKPTKMRFDPKKFALCLAGKLGIDADKALGCAVSCKTNVKCYPGCLGVDAEKVIYAAVECALATKKAVAKKVVKAVKVAKKHMFKIDPKKFAVCIAGKLGIDADKALGCAVSCKTNINCYPSCLGVDAQKVILAAIECVVADKAFKHQKPKSKGTKKPTKLKGFDPKKFAVCLAGKLGIDANKALSCAVSCKTNVKCYPGCLGVDAKKALVAAVECAFEQKKASGSKRLSQGQEKQLLSVLKSIVKRIVKEQKPVRQ